MNKQEIEIAFKFHEEILSQMKYGRDMYEDVCGTGDMLSEDREELYKNMDKDIRMQEVTVLALRYQLTNGWIPVSEQLPKQDEEVLVTDITGKVRLMWIVGDRFENLGNSVEIDFIIAWQPLPEPYKEAL